MSTAMTRSLAAAALVLLLPACAPKLDPARAKPAPEVVGETLDGDAFRLSDLRGKVVLVNHFGTWCPPCRKEMPHLVRMHADLEPRGFEVVAIDHDDTIPAVRAFAQAHGIRFPIVFLPRGSNPFRVRALPANVLLDRQGRVRLRSQGFRSSTAETLRAAAETLLDEPASQ